MVCLKWSLPYLAAICVWASRNKEGEKNNKNNRLKEVCESDCMPQETECFLFNPVEAVKVK